MQALLGAGSEIVVNQAVKDVTRELDITIRGRVRKVVKSHSRKSHRS